MKMAEENIKTALEASTFTLKEKVAFYKKKWRKEHIANIVIAVVLWFAALFVLKYQNVSPMILGGIGGLLAVLFAMFLYNNMMIYVEKHAYDGKGSN